MQNEIEVLDIEAYELVLRGLGALESKNSREMKNAREAILDLLPRLSDPSLAEFAAGLTKVASKIQKELAVIKPCGVVDPPVDVRENENRAAGRMPIEAAINLLVGSAH